MSHAQGRATVICPAKLNLILEVLGLREDGFHEVRLFNTAIGLADRLTVELTDGGIEITCDHPEVPTGDNLCRRAAEAFFGAFPGARTGVKIHIAKRIPVAGGLGGGSSDAAGTLAALNVLTGTGAADARLREIGAEIGSDVPFFLFESPAWALGRGERLIKAEGLAEGFFVVVGQKFGVSAGWSYRQWDLTNGAKRATLDYPETGGITPRFDDFHNDLEAVVSSHYTDISDAIKALRDAGAVTALMSGSGPSAFGVFQSRESARLGALALRGRLGLTVIEAGLQTGRIIEVQRDRIQEGSGLRWRSPK